MNSYGRYYIELRQGGDLVRPLPKWWRGRIAERVNKPHRFTVHLPYDSTLSSELTPTAELWVRDGNFDIVNKFIPRLIDESGPAGYEIKLDCLDIMGQLGREWVSDYTTVDQESPDASPLQTTKTVSTIINDLLDLQSITPAITVDTIDSAIGDQETRLDAERMSILAALNELHADVGGYFWVDVDRGLHWVENIGESLGQQIRLGKNLVNIERRRDFGDMVNRVYAYGAGDGPDTVTVTVEDAGSIASYGLHTGEYFEQRVIDPDVLESHAQSILEHKKEPVVSYTIGAVDLSSAAGDDYAFDYLALGNRYRAIDSVLGIDVEVRAVSVTRILDNPTENQVELANQRAQLSDLFVEERRQRRASQAHNPVGIATEDGNQLDEWATDWNDAAWDAPDGLHYDRAGERINDALADGGEIDESLTDTAESNMGSLPFVARLFTGADLAEIDALPGSPEYPDLEFRDDEDFAFTTTTPEEVLHVRQAGAWVDIAGGGTQIIVAADKAELDGLSPLPEEPAWGYTEDEFKYWALSDGVWVEVGHIVWHIATDKDNLPTVDAPAIGYTTGDDKRWIRLGTEWIEIPTKNTGVVGSVYHGNDATLERPLGYSRILWIGDTEPNNWQVGDGWVDTDPYPDEGSP